MRQSPAIDVITVAWTCFRRDINIMHATRKQDRSFCGRRRLGRHASLHVRSNLSARPWSCGVRFWQTRHQVSESRSGVRENIQHLRPLHQAALTIPTNQSKPTRVRQLTRLPQTIWNAWTLGHIMTTIYDISRHEETETKKSKMFVPLVPVPTLPKLGSMPYFCRAGCVLHLAISWTADDLG